MRSLLGAAGLLVVVAAFAAAATPDFAAMQIQPYEPPKPAPALALPDLDGKTVRLEDFRGKVVLLFFWATW
jgi:cytochrome oxidase Cu insertion factor (SCO1/SenC/PrrC family)